MSPGGATRNANRAVLITGASGALGTAVTERFVEDGHRVVAASLGTDAAYDSQPVAALQADVTDEA